MPGLAPRASAASCSSWTSETEPPPTIRVFRHESGAVETVDFRTYTKNVLSREWIGSWTTESLRSGALAVKSYAWYQVLHWRGGTNSDGAVLRPPGRHLGPGLRPDQGHLDHCGGRRRRHLGHARAQERQDLPHLLQRGCHRTRPAARTRTAGRRTSGAPRPAGWPAGAPPRSCSSTTTPASP